MGKKPKTGENTGILENHAGEKVISYKIQLYARKGFTLVILDKIPRKNWLLRTSVEKIVQETWFYLGYFDDLLH